MAHLGSLCPDSASLRWLPVAPGRHTRALSPGRVAFRLVSSASMRAMRTLQLPMNTFGRLMCAIELLTDAMKAQTDTIKALTDMIEAQTDTMKLPSDPMKPASSR